MDGVLAAFDTGYEEVFGTRPSKADDNVDWQLVREVEGFYRDLPPMPDFDVLWAFVSQFNPTILTGVPRSVKEAPDNKRAWVDKHIGKDQPMIACQSSRKSEYIKNQGDIIIDDWEKYKHIWLKRGGHWITHTSAVSSIDLLKEALDDLSN